MRISRQGRFQVGRMESLTFVISMLVDALREGFR